MNIQDKLTYRSEQALALYARLVGNPGTLDAYHIRHELERRGWQWDAAKGWYFRRKPQPLPSQPTARDLYRHAWRIFRQHYGVQSDSGPVHYPRDHNNRYLEHIPQPIIDALVKTYEASTDQIGVYYRQTVKSPGSAWATHLRHKLNVRRDRCYTVYLDPIDRKTYRRTIYQAWMPRPRKTLERRAMWVFPRFSIAIVTAHYSGDTFPKALAYHLIHTGQVPGRERSEVIQAAAEAKLTQAYDAGEVAAYFAAINMTGFFPDIKPVKYPPKFALP